MQPVIGCDVHKRYSVFVTIDHRGKLSKPDRVEHEREVFRAYLQTLPAGSEIALEATGHRYWIVDEMEQAGYWMLRKRQPYRPPQRKADFLQDRVSARHV